MAFSVKNIVKKRYKAKKHPKRQVQLDRVAYEKITKLRGEISQNPNKDHSSEFSKIVRQFFMALLKIRHHFTYEEFIDDVKGKRLPVELKNEMGDFFLELSELEYKQQSYSVAELDAMIRIFESIIPRVMAEKRGRVKEKKKKGFEKIIEQLHLNELHIHAPRPKSVDGKQEKKIRSKKQKTKKKSSELKPKHIFDVERLFKRRPKDNLLYVYDLIGESYKAITNNKITLADSKILEVESILPLLHTSEIIEIKKDLKKLKKEISDIKKSLKEDIPPPPKQVGIVKKEKVKKKKVERKPLFTKKISDLPELVPLPELEQPVPAKIEKKKIEEIPLPPLPELDSSKKPEEIRDVELPETKKGYEPFNLFSKKENEIEKEIKEVKKKEVELPPLSPAPDFIPKIKEEDLVEEMFEPEPEPLPEAPEPIKEEIPELEPAPESKIKKFKLDQTEIEYYPNKLIQDQPEPSKETLKAIKESEPVVFPTAEDIDLLSLGGINKEGGSFKPKRIFVPAGDGSERVIKPKTPEKETKEKPKSKLTKAKLIETKPLIEERKKQEEILAKMEDLENLIMTAQHMINLKNYPEAKTTYSKALDVKKSLKLKKSDSKKIDYDLQGIDIDLKIAGMT